MAHIVRRNPSATKLTDVESRKLLEQITAMAVEFVAIDAVKPNPRNAKQHPEQQVLLIAENIRKFGVNHPLLIDENNELIGGHARLAAAELLKLPTLPAIRLSNLSAQEKRAVALADNKMLSLELKELTADTGELTFDYTITGFDTPEIDQLLGGDPSLGKPDPADEVPAPADTGASVIRPGDLWVCGPHRLYCGNALDPASYRVLLRGDPADIVFTDPPYNVRVAGHVSQRTDAREFAMASGELSSEEFVDFLQTITAHIAANVANGAVVYICMDWRHLDDLSAATRRYLGKPKNMIVWVKTNGGQGSFYRSQHEHIAVYVAGTAAPTNNFRLGERGRYRTNVWSYAGFNSFGRDRVTALNAHPTMKPIALVADALRDCSKRGDIVLDPFGGSGTTMIAAERTGRTARLIEIDPIYCEVIIRRWQTLSGKTAVLSESNETWDEVAAQHRLADGVRE